MEIGPYPPSRGTRAPYANGDFGLELAEKVYALDSSAIDLCPSVFPWARFSSTKSGIKLHTLLDLRGNIPTFISISKPVSNDKLTELRDKNADPDGNLDKNGNPKKFSRDLESDWTIKNDVPHFGLKEHAAVEVGKGLILSTTLTPASHSDSTYLPYATIYSMHTDQKINVVYADKGYAGSPNRNFLAMNQIADGIMRKNGLGSNFAHLARG